MCNGIQRARRAPRRRYRHLQHMDVDHCCRHVGMPQKLVHGSDLGTHLLDAEAILHVLDSLAQLVQKPGRLLLWRAGFDGIFITGRISSKLVNPPSGKPLMGGIHDQLMEQRPTYRAGFALDITLNFMARLSTTLGILIAVAPVLAVGGCAVLVARYERAFEATTDGQPFSVVTDRFGEPTVRELPTERYLRYSGTGCQSPCAVRLWWEHPVLRGIEAWSVEFDDGGRVVHKAHWVSP